jgi:hypothetical protein
MGKITGLSTKDMSREDWLKQRENGIGGSDVASILGLDKYKPALKLFHQKTALWETDETDNIAMYAGRISEEHIYNHYWRYWDSHTSDELDMLYNATNSLVQRTASRRDEIITNSDYPHLKANIDYEIDDHDGERLYWSLKLGVSNTGVNGRLDCLLDTYIRCNTICLLQDTVIQRYLGYLMGGLQRYLKFLSQK